MNIQDRSFTPRAAASRPQAPSPRLVRAAHEFEASILQELVRPLEQSAFGDQPGGNALHDLASQALAEGMAAHGGLGIASTILNSLSARQRQDHACSGARACAIGPLRPTESNPPDSL